VRRSPGLGLLATLIIQAVASMAVLAVPAMAPAFASALGVLPTWIGVYVGVVYVGAMLASMASGPLVLRLGAIRTSQMGLLSCTVGMAVLAESSSMPSALLGALFVGAGYGPITPASSHILARTVSTKQVALMFSIKQTGVPLGGVMAGVLVPPLVVAGGVQIALWSVAVGALVAALLAQPLRAALDMDRQPGYRLRVSGFASSLRLVAQHPLLTRLAVVSFVFSVAQGCLATYLVTYLHGTLDYSLIAAGAALSVAQVGGVVGRILWGFLADRRFGALRTLSGLAVLMAVCAATTAALHAGVPMALTLALLAVFGASAAGWNGVYLAEVARRAPPGMAGAATGGTLSVTFLGVVIGPMLFGVIADAFGSYRSGFLALALPAALCAWRLAIVAHRDRSVNETNTST